jgi:hypothetical protein
VASDSVAQRSGGPTGSADVGSRDEHGRSFRVHVVFPT